MATQRTRRRVLFRCDASPEIGLGHLTRCRSLALAVRDAGIDTAFAMRRSDHSEALQRAGFAVHTLDAPDDAGATTALAHELGAQCVLVDHYDADARYFAVLGGASFLVAAIDDRADRDLTSVDWLLNQNLAATTLDYRVRADCELLLGTGYALLRPAFAEERELLARTFTESDNRLLVTFGGGDTTTLAAAALDSLSAVMRSLDVRLIVGDAAAADSLAARAAASPHAVDALHGVEAMETQMSWADLSLNAGGSTCWELMCLGVPMVVTSASADQRLNQEPLERAGVAVALAVNRLGDAGAVVERLFGDPVRRSEMSATAANLVDGRGAVRAAASLARLLASDAS